jgi:5-methylcytosine-specific restriction enzyme A
MTRIRSARQAAAARQRKQRKSTALPVETPEAWPIGEEPKRAAPWPRTSTKASGSRGFYSNSARWRRESKGYLAEHPTCECEDPLCNQPTFFVDHIQPIRDPTNLADPMIWDRANWQALSKTCHFIKSRREQGEAGKLAPVKRQGPRIRGVDPETGMPLDPHHFWHDPEWNTRKK